ncbi:TonB-dependent receptor [Pseudopedobacter sp.]|uniref:SusC/RagA family TonB-linked outer membrane protein n=1 Tax=Pseudopedobacter sp. TaxID=1936787 RepID=UPI0033424583
MKYTIKSALFYLLFTLGILLSVEESYGQLKVSGKVLDTEGNSLPGVTIKVKGNQSGTISDANGNFSLAVNNNNEILVLSYIGFKTKELPANNSLLSNIVMEIEESKSLDQIVVIGYGVSKLGDVTGSISNVRGDILTQTGANNVSEALQGRVAGLKVNNQSGEPGGSISMQIRGANSINASSSPLFVIDGLQIDVNGSEVATSSVGGYTGYNPLATLNPNDIESIDILKDASATAIYGSRGANGVVIITTKSGKGKNSLINVNYQIGLSEATKKLEMLGSQDYVNFRHEWDRSSLTWGVDLDNDGKADEPVNANNFEQYNWQDLFLRTGQTQKFNLTAQGGNNTTDFILGLGYNNQEGIIVGNDYKQYSAQTKVNHKLSRNIDVGMNVNYGRTVTDGAVSSGGGAGSYSGLIQSIYNEKPIGIFVDQENEGGGSYTPLTTMFYESYKNVSLDRALGNAFLTWQIIPGLSLRVSGSGNTSFSKLQEFYGKETRWGSVNNGRAEVMNIQTTSYTQSNTLTYNKRVKNKYFNALLGQEFNSYNIENSRIRAYSFEDESTGVFDMSKAGIVDKPQTNISDTKRLSFFGRVNYSVNYKYNFTASMRADGSSNFGKGNRFAYFPSAAFAWRINNEKFMSAFKKQLSNLKLRLSYGITGNDRIPAYSALARLGNNNYAGNGTPIFGMAPSSSPNPDLKWESTEQFDMGLDVGLFNERISVTADIYKKITRDLLLNTPIPSQTGFSSQYQNIGKIQNKGIEITINSVNVKKDNFSWSSSLNFDRNLNKVLSLGDSEFLPVVISNGFLTDVSRVIVGNSIGTGFGYVADGNYQFSDFTITNSGGQVIDPSTITTGNYDNYTYTLNQGVTSIAAVSVKPGDRRYKDLDGNGIINAEDRKVISNSNPDFNIGFSNNFKYKQFDLTLFFEGVFGNEIMNAFINNSEAGLKGAAPAYNITKAYFDNRWTPSNPSNTYSRLKNNTNDFVSTYYVEDGSFVRFKNLSLGYTLNPAIARKLHVKNIRFNFTIDNLYVWTKYSGLDPDIRSASSLMPGYDRLSYPRARNYFFGLNVGF